MVVIHAEEEFDWDSGFFRSNNNMTHSTELISMVEHILGLGGKVILAMDYPFVCSSGGKKVIRHFQDEAGCRVEFATHLHPWVNPPFENDEDKTSIEDSYPGNLSAEAERDKLSLLTELIATECGVRPTTYLAGRYGIGANTQLILKELGYTSDLSISAYCDFTHQQGPDFSHYTNSMFVDNGITYLPHTSSVLSLFPSVTSFLNRNPKIYSQLTRSKIGSLSGRFLRIRRYRLSPEGFTFRQMKAVTESQLSIGQNEFIVSFHSPTVKPGLTPYTRSPADVEYFKQALTEYLQWFTKEMKGEYVLPRVLDSNEQRVSRGQK